jgi:hypothetical protein
MRQEVKDAATGWVAGSAIWIPVTLAVFEAFNLVLNKVGGLQVRTPPLLLMSGAVAAGAIAALAGYLARQKAISEFGRNKHRDS